MTTYIKDYYKYIRRDILDKVTKILASAKNGIPVALSRYNDGEVGIMFNQYFVAARGDQRGTIGLQTALLDAIKYEQKNYWKGFPCPVCMRKQRVQLDLQNMINYEYLYNTCAVVNTNRNLEKFSFGLQKALKHKQVVWVSGEGQDLSVLNFNIVRHIEFARKNSWELYEKIKGRCLSVARPNRVFLLSCGPTARVLVRNLFQLRPDCSFLDIGSTYDNLTRDVWHKCHLGALKDCTGCN